MPESESALVAADRGDLGRALSDLQAEVAELRAFQQIGEALARYCRGIDRCDAEVLKTVYHPDSTDVHGTAFSGNGHDFADYIVTQLGGGVLNHHVVGNELIELDGDRAYVESSYSSLHRYRSADGVLTDRCSLGRYLDVFTRRDGCWAIAHRRVIVESLVTAAVPGQDLLAASGGPADGQMQPAFDRSDPSYLRFGIADIGNPASPDDGVPSPVPSPTHRAPAHPAPPRGGTTR